MSYHSPFQIPTFGSGPERFFALNRATLSRDCSFAKRRVTISRYFFAFNTIQPPTTRSIRRPSKSCPGEISSGLSRISTAFMVPAKGTLARIARFLTLPNLQKPSSSIEASKVIQTRTVSLSSSQMEESSIELNSLLYIAAIVTLRPLQSVTVTKCNAIRSRIINTPQPPSEGGVCLLEAA